MRGVLFLGFLGGFPMMIKSGMFVFFFFFLGGGGHIFLIYLNINIHAYMYTCMYKAEAGNPGFESIKCN